MFERIKNWFRNPQQQAEFEVLNNKLDHLKFYFETSKPKEPLDITLLRHQLASVDLSDIEDKEESETERREYCAAISAVFPRIEKDIKKFLYTQLLFASNEATTWEQTIFGRGTFNGMDLLLEHWRKANAEHIERSKPKEGFDPHNPIGEIDA